MKGLLSIRSARVLLSLLLVIAAGRTTASSLLVSAKHDVLVVQNEKRQSFRTLFTDDELIVDVTLNVYFLEQLPSSKAHYDELRRLNASSWLEAVKLTLATADGRKTALPSPRIISSSARRRGPGAERAVDRDTSVDMSAYRAALGFGSIPPGDYVLTATVQGLNSTFPFAVRTGSEREFRDHYLRLKATRTSDYSSFRRLQLERRKANPARLDALYALIDRALVNGTLTETTSYFERAIAAANLDLQKTSDPVAMARIESGLAELRAVKSVLPEYFGKRDVWMMTRDVKDGHYSIRQRASGAVVRDFKGQKAR